MHLTSWLSLFKNFGKRKNQARRSRPAAIDRLESLENRALLTAFIPGTIQGQDGWSGGIGPINTQITQRVDQTGNDAHSGVGSWLMSNSTGNGAYVAGYFGTMPFSPQLAVSAGEPNAATGADQFNATFWFKSANTVADGSHVEVDFGNPEGNNRGNSFYITNFDNDDGGLTLRVNSPNPNGSFPAQNHPELPSPGIVVADGLSRDTWHRIDIVAKFNNGDGDDTFEIHLDGVAIINPVTLGTEFPTFEYYFESEAIPSEPLANRLFFRNTYKANQLLEIEGNKLATVLFSDNTAPQGFFFDDIRYSVSNQSNPGVTVASYTATFEFETSTTYVDDSWAGLNFNDPIVDADLSTPGNQPATFGLDAFSTIQGGVNAVAAGGTTIVNAGTYAEKVSVSKSVRILGAQDGVDAQTGRVGAQESIMTGAAGSTSFYITADNVVVDGFTLQGATNGNNFGAAVFMGPGTAGTQILNNIVQNNIVGVFASNDSAALQTLIQQNLFRNNTMPGPSGGTDIYLDQYTAGVGAQNIKIDNNTFTNSAFQEDSWGIGVSNTDVTPISDLIITNNTITNHGRGMYFFSTDGATITGNTITGATRYGIGIFDSGVAGTESSGFVIDNNTITTSGTGIDVSIDNAGYTGPLVVTDSGMVDVVGTDGDDTVTLSVVGGQLQYTLGGNTFDITGATGFNFDGGDGTDTFTIDFSGAPGLFNLPITFNGGDGPGIDTLTTFGGTFTNGRVTATGSDSGTIQYSGGAGLITFTGLEPVIDDNIVTNYTIDATTSPDTISILDGVAARTIVREASTNFEEVAFKNKTNVTIRGLGGKDTFVLNNPNPAFGLSSLTLNGGGGSDVVQVTTGYSLPGGAIEFNVENVELSANVTATISGEATSVKVLTTAAEIQDGVDAAAATGGVVSIATGSYIGSVDTTGKSVTLAPVEGGNVTLSGSLTLSSDDFLAFTLTADSVNNSFAVAGAVSLGGVSVLPTLDYAAEYGDFYTLIQSTTSTTGLINSIPEGGILVVGPTRYIVSYVGGVSQHDVTLTVARPPVTVSFSNGNLVVTGTTDKDEFTVEVTGTNQVRLIGADGTNFTGAGGDNVAVGPFNVLGTLTVNTGDGNDIVTLTGVGANARLAGGKVSFNLGAGNDQLSQGGIAPLTLTNSLAILGGTGSDLISLGLGDTLADLVAAGLTIDNGADDGTALQSIELIGVTVNGNTNLTNSGRAVQTVLLGSSGQDGAANDFNGNLTITQSNALGSADNAVGIVNSSISGYLLVNNGLTAGTNIVTVTDSDIGGLSNLTNGNATVGNTIAYMGATVTGNTTLMNGNSGATNAIVVNGSSLNGKSIALSNGTAGVSNLIDLGAGDSSTYAGNVQATNSSATGTNVINVAQGTFSNIVTLNNKLAGATINTIDIGATGPVSVVGNLVISNAAATELNEVAVSRLTTSGLKLGDVSISNGASDVISVLMGEGGANTVGGNLSIRNQAATGQRQTAINATTVNGASGLYVSNAGTGESQVTIGVNSLVTVASALKIEEGVGNTFLNVGNVFVGSLNFAALGAGVNTILVGGTFGTTAVVTGSTRITTGVGGDIVEIGTLGSALLQGAVSVTLGDGDDRLTVGDNASSTALLTANFLFDGGAGQDTFIGSPTAITGYTAGPTAPGGTLKSKITAFEFYELYVVDNG